MKQLLFVAVGGATGSVLRYLTNLVTMKYYSASFPLATFFVNIVGCFLAGLIFGIFKNETAEAQNLKSLLLVGFCGGFTTFSAFALENIKLMNSGNLTSFVVYTFASLAAGFVAVWAGLAVAR